MQLTPRDAGALTSLDDLGEELTADAHERVRLLLWWCKSLRSLRGVERAPALEALELLSCDALEGLEPLAGMTLRRLSIAQCAGALDLRPVAKMRGLVELVVNHNPAITDLSPLAELEHLELLDLFGNSVPPALRGRHLGREAIAKVRAQLRRP
jgi:hypothetical protein